MSATEEPTAALQGQIETLQRQIKLLNEGLQQAERIRLLWEQSVQELQATKRALKDSRAFFDRVFTAAPDPIVVTDHGGRIVLANSALGQLVGLTGEQLTGRHVLRLLTPPDRRRALVAFRKSRDGSSEFAIGGQQEARLVATKWTMLPGARGAKPQVIITGQDITERKRVEEDLRESNAELSVLQQVSSAVARTMELNELYRTIFDTMAAALDLAREDEQAIFTVEDRLMKLVAHQGASKELAKLNDGAAMSGCPCGMSAREGEVIVIPTCTARPPAGHRAPRPHGHIIIPLKAHEQVLGVFCCCTAEYPNVEARRIKTLKAIGEQMGIAMENAMLYEEKKALSLHDPLTGLANRRCMDITMPKVLARAKRYHSQLSLIMLDIDHFKRYNDTYGHQAGDQLLATAGRILGGQIRDADLIVRYGGEEFMVMLPETALVGAQWVAERMRKAIENQTTVTVSLGVASLPAAGCTMEELVRMADEALYRAKRGGRNRVEIAPVGA